MCLYHTCPKCGANLDPGEQCDCEKINSYPSQDRLIIGFDNASNGDKTCLMTSRISQNRVVILSCYYDDEAREMYSKLTEQPTRTITDEILSAKI